MNALFGLILRDGQPIRPGQLEGMQDAFRVGSEIDGTYWWSETAGLGTVWSGADIGPGYEPVHDSTGNLTLVAAARLIHRAELADALGMAPTASASLSDAGLILAAWQRWEADCIHRLEGDWHFALWDRSRRRLFLARDTHGTASLYYRLLTDGFAFASIQKPLLSLSPPALLPNLRRMAQILGGVPGEGRETGYAEIQRLPPAHHLTLEDQSIRVGRYWFPEALPDLHLDDEAALEGFLHHYRRAVHSRLARRGKTGLMLSGGLDSGSLAGLAAPALAQRGQQLHAFTSVPAGEAAPELVGRVPVDEGPLAAAVAATVGHIVLAPIDAAHISPLAGMARMLAVHDEPVYPSSNSFWLAAIQSAAQAQGVTTLLTGTAGNDTVSWRGAPPVLTHLLATGSVGELAQQVRSLKARSGLSTVQLLWVTLGKPLLRPLWQGLPLAVRTAAPDWSALTPLHPNFARQPQIAELLAAETIPPDPARATRQAWASWRLGSPGRWLPPTFHFQDSHAFGLDVLDPTADKRLMEFCFALDVGHYHDGATDRRLIRRAMQGILPDEVRLMRRRPRQSADLVSRLHTHRDELQATVSRVARHPLAAEVVDMARLAEVAGQIGASPQGVDYLTANALLLRGLMAGMFLERF